MFSACFYVTTLGIEITGNEEAHQINSSVSISCSSDLPVQTIRWLNNGQQLFNNSGQQQLLLQIESSPALNNTEYICEVTLETGRVLQRTITVQVNGKMGPLPCTFIYCITLILRYAAPSATNNFR